MALFNDLLTDAQWINLLLQAAVVHYPRPTAFSFTALLLRRETMANNRALILRFHT